MFSCFYCFCLFFSSQSELFLDVLMSRSLEVSKSRSLDVSKSTVFCSSIFLESIFFFAIGQHSVVRYMYFFSALLITPSGTRRDLLNHVVFLSPACGVIYKSCRFSFSSIRTPKGNRTPINMIFDTVRNYQNFSWCLDVSKSRSLQDLYPSGQGD